MTTWWHTQCRTYGWTHSMVETPFWWGALGPSPLGTL